MEDDNLLRYKCRICGNTCLVATPPDNSVCGGCNNPMWELMKIQEPYKVTSSNVTNINFPSMNFERNQISKDSLGVGSVKIALQVDSIFYSKVANEHKVMKIHEFINLVNLWKTLEWQKAPDFIKDSLLKHNIYIHLSIDDPKMSLVTLKLTDIKDEYLRFKDDQVIHYNLPR